MHAKSWLWVMMLVGIALLAVPGSQAMAIISPGDDVNALFLHCHADPQNGVTCVCETPESSGGLVWLPSRGIGIGVGLPPTYTPCFCVAVTC